MTATRAEVAAMRTVRGLLLNRVRRSVTSASSTGRTVLDPAAAAEYVVNALTVHERGLLAQAALTFARAEVEAQLAATEDEE